MAVMPPLIITATNIMCRNGVVHCNRQGITSINFTAEKSNINSYTSTVNNFTVSAVGVY